MQFTNFKPSFSIQQIINSQTNTSKQQITDTLNSPASNQAATRPAAKAIAPAIGLCVALIIAGKVITESVTYGT